MHILSLPIPPLFFGGIGISIEAKDDYVDNVPNADASEEPFSDEKEDAAVWVVVFYSWLLLVMRKKMPLSG